MATNTASGRLTGDQILAVVSGGFVGAILLGLVVQAGLGREGILAFGALVARPEYGTGWIVLFVVATVFSVVFVGFVSRSLDSFVNRVIGLSRRSEVLQSVLVPLLERSALTVTTTALGAVFGLALWVVFYVLFVPAWLQFVVGTDAVALPNLAPVGFVAWVLYGVLTGALYGLVLDS